MKKSSLSIDVSNFVDEIEKKNSMIFTQKHNTSQNDGIL
jgi:hypothetical protein